MLKITSTFYVRPEKIDIISAHNKLLTIFINNEEYVFKVDDPQHVAEALYQLMKQDYEYPILEKTEENNTYKLREQALQYLKWKN